MPTAPYLSLDSSLPDVGASVFRVRPVTSAGAEAVFTATNTAALASMRGYLRSYAGPSGGLIWGVAGAFACWAAGLEWYAAGLFGLAGAQGWVVMEIRRHARMWQSLVDARLEQLAGATARGK